MVNSANTAFQYLYDHITFSGKLTALLPDAVPRIPILCVCAPLAGATAACITNPMDVIRARIQVCDKLFVCSCLTSLSTIFQSSDGVWL